MRISKVKEVLRQVKDLVVFLWGPPGIGKSAIVRQIADEEGIGFIDLRLSLLDPVDLRGLPRFTDGHVSWARPDFIPAEGQGILFLDELNTAAPAVQNAALQLVLDRAVGPHRLGDGWRIICAGNRKEHRAHVWELSAPLMSRMVHLDVEANLDDWTAYAVQKGINPLIVGFLSYRPGLLLSLPERNESFPCPRSWEFLSKLPESLLSDAEVVAGIIGKGAAAEFCGYVRDYRELPDIERIIKEKKIEGFKNLKPSIKYATVSAVAYRTIERKLAETALAIALQLPGEFSVLLIKIVYPKLKERLTSLADWKKFVKENGDLIL